jgi:ankyrin repeat protein
VNFKDSHKRTALSLAAENGYEAVIKLLLAKEGIDPSSTDKYGRTALPWAAKNKHETAVKLLLSTETAEPATQPEP